MSNDGKKLKELTAIRLGITDEKFDDPNWWANGLGVKYDGENPEDRRFIDRTRTEAKLQTLEEESIEMAHNALKSNGIYRGVALNHIAALIREIRVARQRPDKPAGARKKDSGLPD